MSTINQRSLKPFLQFFARFGVVFLAKRQRTRRSYQKTSSRFSEHIIIEDRRSTVLWPQNNGDVERKNRSLLEFQQVAHEEKNNWPQN